MYDSIYLPNDVCYLHYDTVELPRDTIYLTKDAAEINMNNLLSPVASKLSIAKENKHFSNATLTKERYQEKISERSPLAFELRSNNSSDLKWEGERVGNNRGIFTIDEYEFEDSYRFPKESYTDKFMKKDRSEKVISTNILKKKFTNYYNGYTIGEFAEQHTGPKAKVKNIKKNPIKMYIDEYPHKEETDLVGERKTIYRSQDSIVELQRRNKDLEHALHLETIISYELRTKLSVLTSLLDTKFKDPNCPFSGLLKMGNSSKYLKHIDIFLYMKKLQKYTTYKSVLNERLKYELRLLTYKLEYSYRKKKLYSPPNAPINKQTIPKRGSPMKNILKEIDDLKYYKYSLFVYIEYQKTVLQAQKYRIKQLEDYINRLSNKEQHYVNHYRPKLIYNLTERDKQLHAAYYQQEQLRMEFNLIEFNLIEQIEALKNETKLIYSQMKEQLTNLEKKNEALYKEILTKTYVYSSRSSQAVQFNDDFGKSAIIEQYLILLKTERDYFRQYCKKFTYYNHIIHSLRLQLKSLQTYLAKTQL